MPDGKDLEIEASEIDNAENAAKKEPKILGRFPGVVSFYHSDKQRDGNYGSNDSVKIPTFGFDPYIPKLYGEDSRIRDSYIKSDSIVSGYEATKDSGDKVEICVYPQRHELVHGSTPALTGVSKGQELRYYSQWLNPTANEMTLSVFVNYPDPDTEISPKDDFIKYKDSANEDNDIEKIFFRLVKVTTDWKPVEITSGSLQYYGIAQELDLTQEQQDKRNNLPQQKQDIEGLKAQIDAKNGEIAAKQSELDIVNTDISTNRTNRSTAYNDMTKLMKENGYPSDAKEITSARPNYPKIKAKNDEVGKLDKAHDKLKNKKTALEGEIKQKNSELAALESDKASKESHVAKIEAEIANEDSFMAKDEALTLSGSDSFDFTFRTAKDAERKTNITITNGGGNKNAALIAFYKRKEKVKETKDGTETEKEVEREYIVGQVNILAADFYKSIIPSNLIKGDDYRSIENLFNPMPIHFVKVSVKKWKQKSDGSFEEGSKVECGLPNGGNLGGVVSKVNEYFRQSGISFYQTSNPPHSEVEALVIKFKTRSDNPYDINGKTVLRIGGTDFITDGDFLTVNVYVHNVTDESGDLYKELQLLFKRKLMNEVLFNKKGSLYENMDIWEKCYTLPDEKSIPVTTAYRRFIEACPDLFPLKTVQGILGSKRIEDAQLLWRRAKAITEFIVKNTCIVFMIDQFTGEGESSKHTAAYAKKGANGVVMYNAGLTTWEDTLPHEIGHSLGLPHTFETTYPMFPDKVSFNSSNWNTKKTTIADNDTAAYAATYTNIMDYKSESSDSHKNSSYARSLFTKWQWEKMQGNIKFKSYEASLPKGYKNGLNDINDNERVKQVAKEIKKILG